MDTVCDPRVEIDRHRVEVGVKKIGVDPQRHAGIDDVVWALPTAKVFVVIRQNATVAVDASAYFSSDRLGVRCTLRAAFAFPHEAGVVKLSIGGS